MSRWQKLDREGMSLARGVCVRGSWVALWVWAWVLLAATANAQHEPSAAAAPPSVVPPTQTRFVEAEYPAAARQKGLEAKVVLRLRIDEQGNVTEALVEQGAGHGFDEAARRAALGFKFEPARQDGEPVAAIILYQYRFTLDKAEPRTRSEETPSEEKGRAKARASVAL